MNSEQFEKICLAKPEAELTYPFGPEAKVFKVGGKMFALMSNMNGAYGVNLKCEPDEASDLRLEYEGIKPGYHMNKDHWNTIEFESDVPDDLYEYLVDNSFALVVSSLKKSERERFRIVHGITLE